MELTPNDVEQKAFTQALRGYQMDEVDDFLDEIVTAFALMTSGCATPRRRFGPWRPMPPVAGAMRPPSPGRSWSLSDRPTPCWQRPRSRPTDQEQRQGRNREFELQNGRWSAIAFRAEIDGMRQTGSRRLRETLATLASAVAGRSARWRPRSPAPKAAFSRRRPQRCRLLTRPRHVPERHRSPELDVGDPLRLGTTMPMSARGGRRTGQSAARLDASQPERRRRRFRRGRGRARGSSSRPVGTGLSRLDLVLDLVDADPIGDPSMSRIAGKPVDRRLCVGSRRRIQRVR